jgi:hypothetical protein
MDNGGRKNAMSAIIITPPPRPNVADTTEVKKLARHRVTNAVLEISGVFPIMSYMSVIGECDCVEAGRQSIMFLADMTFYHLHPSAELMYFI